MPCRSVCVAGVSGGLTDIVFMVDDRVEGHIFVFQVSLRGLHVVGAVVGLDEALKLAIHYRAVGDRAFLTWGATVQSSNGVKAQIRHGL